MGRNVAWVKVPTTYTTIDYSRFWKPKKSDNLIESTYMQIDRANELCLSDLGLRREEINC